DVSGTSQTPAYFVMEREPAGAPPTLTVMRVGQDSGSANSAPPGITCGIACAAGYSTGTAVILTATLASGGTFGGWQGCDTVSGLSCTLTLTTSRFVAAGFGPKLALNFVHFAQAGNFGTNFTPTVSYPASVNSYSADLNVTMDSNFSDGSTILVTGPTGSGMSNAPANFFTRIQATSAFY